MAHCGHPRLDAEREPIARSAIRRSGDGELDVVGASHRRLRRRAHPNLEIPRLARHRHEGRRAEACRLFETRPSTPRSPPQARWPRRKECRCVVFMENSCRFDGSISPTLDASVPPYPRPGSLPARGEADHRAKRPSDGDSGSRRSRAPLDEGVARRDRKELRRRTREGDTTRNGCGAGRSAKSAAASMTRRFSPRRRPFDCTGARTRFASSDGFHAGHDAWVSPARAGADVLGPRQGPHDAGQASAATRASSPSRR